MDAGITAKAASTHSTNCACDNHNVRLFGESAQAPMSEINRLEHSLIESRLAAYQSQRQVDLSRAFQCLSLDLIFPRKNEDSDELITDGSGDRGVDAVYIREHGSTATIDIIQFKYHSNFTNCRRNFPETEVHKIISFLSEVFDRNTDILNDVNIALRKRIEQIYSLLDRSIYCKYRVLFISNGMPLISGSKRIMQDYCARFDWLKFEEVSFSDIARLIYTPDQVSESGHLQIIDRQAFDRSDGDVKGAVACVDAYSYLQLIAGDDVQSIKRHLFNENIRVYLGLEGGYNTSIYNSALSDDNRLFWYLNNGLTITCNKFEYNAGIRNAKLFLSNFQIVNGAQTSHALFDAYHRDPEKVRNVLLLVKVYETSRDDISRKVAIATNSQARILDRDLRANDEIQLKIEGAFRERGYYYERKKGQHTEAEGPKVDAFKLGQIILSYLLEEPEKARVDSNEIFGTRYESIFHEQYNIEELVDLWELAQEVEKIRQVELEKSRASTEDERLTSWLPYGNWHVLYAIRLVAKFHQRVLPERSEWPQLLDRATNAIQAIVDADSRTAVYELFRSRRTRDKVFDAVFPKAQQLRLFD